MLGEFRSNALQGDSDRNAPGRQCSRPCRPDSEKPQGAANGSACYLGTGLNQSAYVVSVFVRLHLQMSFSLGVPGRGSTGFALYWISPTGETRRLTFSSAARCLLRSFPLSHRRRCLKLTTYGRRRACASPAATSERPVRETPQNGSGLCDEMRHNSPGCEVTSGVT